MPVDADFVDIANPASEPVERISGVRLVRRPSAPGIEAGALVLAVASEAVVQSAFDPPGPLYLRLTPGDKVTNLKPIDDKRMMGYLNGRAGLFPRWKIASIDEVLFAGEVIQHSGAQLELGERYADGSGGVKINAVKSSAWLAEAAKQKNPDAMCALAQNYVDAHGVPESPAKAIELYREAANFGHAVAQFQLGRHYQLGKGVPQDMMQSIAYYQKASKQGYHEAKLYLGLFYYEQREYTMAYGEFSLAAEQDNWLAVTFQGLCLERGYGMPMDCFKAVKLYTRAADHGCVLAYYRLGKCYIRGRGVEKKDQTHGMSLVLYSASSAYSPSAEAQCYLGRLYRDGVAVAKDLNISYAWFKKAADNGKRAAIFELGECYAKGRGKLPDAEQAFTYYKQAAEREKSSAQCAVGVYLAAKGDLKKAMGWFEKAGRQGNLVALFEHAKIHLTIEKNPDKAVAYMRKAAEGGLIDAQLALGRLLRGGVHVARSVASAVTWFQRAAELGSTEAMRELAGLYLTGEADVPVDETKAVACLRRAASLGDPLAQSRLATYQRRRDREARLREKAPGKRKEETAGEAATKEHAAEANGKEAKRPRSVRMAK